MTFFARLGGSSLIEGRCRASAGLPINGTASLTKRTSGGQK